VAREGRGTVTCLVLAPRGTTRIMPERGALPGRIGSHHCHKESLLSVVIRRSCAKECRRDIV